MPRLTPERIAELRKLQKIPFLNVDPIGICIPRPVLNVIDDLLSDLAEQTERAEKVEQDLLNVRADYARLNMPGDQIAQMTKRVSEEDERIRELLRDIYDLNREERAIGSGPGFAERKSAVMRRVAEEFEP